MPDPFHMPILMAPQGDKCAQHVQHSWPTVVDINSNVLPIAQLSVASCLWGSFAHFSWQPARSSITACIWRQLAHRSATKPGPLFPHQHGCLSRVVDGLLHSDPPPTRLTDRFLAHHTLLSLSSTDTRRPTIGHFNAGESLVAVSVRCSRS